eukprot:1955867-Alexandrium_andersonii.AAC.1
MSASLVGSEMCIRDRSSELQNLATDKFEEGLLLWENWVEYYQRVSGLSCLLYTSDAADDM